MASLPFLRPLSPFDEVAGSSWTEPLGWGDVRCSAPGWGPAMCTRAVPTVSRPLPSTAPGINFAVGRDSMQLDRHAERWTTPGSSSWQPHAYQQQQQQQLRQPAEHNEIKDARDARRRLSGRLLRILRYDRENQWLTALELRLAIKKKRCRPEEDVIQEILNEDVHFLGRVRYIDARGWKTSEYRAAPRRR